MRHGFLLVNKPAGPTSHDIVQVVRKKLHESKVGHLGTLDPAASGLLVLAVGAKALKVVELFRDLHKEYEAVIHFGAVSTTYDREGVIEEVAAKSGWVIPEEATVRRIITNHFLGKVQQVPPAYSAVHIGGERAYRKMRQGRGVNIPPRDVEIRECDVLSYMYPDICLRIVCSSGTYIRSIAHDLGQVLRCGGYLKELRRTKVGEWSLEDAVDPDHVAWGHVMPLKEVLQDFSRVDLTSEEMNAVRYGQNINREVKQDTLGWFDGLPIVILGPMKDGSRMAHPRKVF